MHRLLLLAAFAPSLLLNGCNQLKSPEKIAELERRVDELSKVVSAIKGKPVGARKGSAEEGEEEEEEDGGEGEAEADGDDAHAKEGDEKPAHAEKDKDAKDEKDDKDDKDAEPAKDAKPAKDDKGHDDAHAKDEPADKAADEKAKPPTKVAAHTGPAHWTYAGETGPEHWGELDEAWATCGTGKQQSPIDIVPHKGRASEILFVYGPSRATVVDNGHTLQVGFAPGNSIFIDGHRYDLVQFHVHTPSEHTIAGDRFPLEVHLVHKDKDGKLAVIGVLYDAGAPSPVLAALWRKWPAKQNQEKPLSKAFDPSALLPENRSVYRYEGSLTTPPCSEGVVWNVMRRTKTDSSAQLDSLKKRYPMNSRPVASSEGREVE